MSTALDSLTSITTLVTELKTLLSGLIGKFDDGKDAFWVEPPYIPSKRTFTGLMVVCDRNSKPFQPQKACVGSPQVIQRLYRKVTLVNNDFSPEGLSKWDTAIDLIRKRFPLNRERAVETTEDTFPQVTFLLDYSAIENLI